MAEQKENYIKLFRKMLNWGWYKDTNTFRVFMHILLKANYQPSEYKGHKIDAGECVFGRKKWAEDLGLSERQVRTAIEHLKSTNEIATKTTNKFTIITVVNWELWQIEEGVKRPTKRPTRSQTSDQQPTTSKEYKNNISSSLGSEDIYSGLPGELKNALMEFEQMRNKNRKPMTDRAKVLLLNKLDSLAGNDTDLKIKLLEEAILHGWQSVYPLNEERNEKSGTKSKNRKSEPSSYGTLSDFGEIQF